MPSMNVKEIALDSVFFQVNRNYTEESAQEDFPYKLKLDSQLDETGKALLVKLGVATARKEEEPNYPFYFDLTVAGLFEFADTIEEKLRPQYATINCPAILFPYVREALADLTRRAGFPPLHLPVVNFLKIARKEAGKDEAPPPEGPGPAKQPRTASPRGKTKKPKVSG